MLERFFVILGSGWSFLILLSLASWFFAYWIPKSKVKIFIHAPATMPRKILDEFFWTWTPEDARRFFQEIGPGGRIAYRKYYWQLDFWFPVLTASLANTSLLLIAIGPHAELAWISLFAMLGLVFDLAENLNHFKMSHSYPSLSPFSLRFGPLFTFIKWVFAVAPSPVAILFFLLRAFGVFVSH